MTQDLEATEAVRSVVREALDRAGEDAEANWQALAAAGLLSLPVPEAYGGEGLGLAEVAVLLRETGQRVVQLPVWETLCCGVLTLAAAGSAEQQQALLPGVASGETLLTPGAARVRQRDDVRRRHGHRPQDRRDVRRPGRPAARHRDRRRPRRWSRWSTRPDPASQLLPSSSSTGATQHTVVLDGAPAELLPGDDAARILTRAGDRRAVPDRGRRGRRRARPDRDVHQGPHPVRPVAGGVPGGGDADRRRLHRLAHPRPGRRQRRLADRRGPRRHRRPRGRGVLGLPRGARRDAHLPPPARRHGRRHHLPDAPLLLLGHRHLPRARRAGRGRARRGPDDQEPRAHRRAARAQGRAAGVLRRPRRRERAPRHGPRPARRDLPARGAADGRRRLDGHRLAEGVRRPRARRDRADDLRQRGAARRRAPAGGDAADRRPDADQVRHREAEGPVPEADPRRRRALRDRLQRAGRRHRPRVAAHHREAGRRPLRRQRPEDVDHRRPPGRLPVARGAHRPGRPQAQGHLDPDRRHHRPGLLATRRSSPPTARTTSTRRTSTTCGCRSTCWSARRTRAGS